MAYMDPTRMKKPQQALAALPGPCSINKELTDMDSLSKSELICKPLPLGVRGYGGHNIL